MNYAEKILNSIVKIFLVYFSLVFSLSLKAEEPKFMKGSSSMADELFKKDKNTDKLPESYITFIAVPPDEHFRIKLTEDRLLSYGSRYYFYSDLDILKKLKDLFLANKKGSLSEFEDGLYKNFEPRYIVQFHGDYATQFSTIVLGQEFINKSSEYIAPGLIYYSKNDVQGYIFKGKIIDDFFRLIPYADNFGKKNQPCDIYAMKVNGK